MARPENIENKSGKPLSLEQLKHFGLYPDTPAWNTNATDSMIGEMTGHALTLQSDPDFAKEHLELAIDGGQLDHISVRKMQAALNKALEGTDGFVPLAVDGSFGRKTTEAMTAFLKNNPELWETINPSVLQTMSRYNTVEKHAEISDAGREVRIAQEKSAPADIRKDFEVAAIHVGKNNDFKGLAAKKGLADAYTDDPTWNTFIDHLVDREGVRTKVYKDSLGYPTVGVGHLVKPEDGLSVGDKISKEQVAELLRKDASWAYEAAQEQAAELGITNPKFVATLASVNYQLGEGWRKEFPNTWQKLKDGDYDGAARNVENSLWARQTPKRTGDFVSAIRDIEVNGRHGGSITLASTDVGFRSEIIIPTDFPVETPATGKSPDSGKPNFVMASNGVEPDVAEAFRGVPYKLAPTTSTPGAPSV